MNTPIYDFARRYAESNAIRMHMPGHKGTAWLGCEPYDLTEISGADELFAPEGIIAESEANASALFGCRTLYSAEGSSLCIRAMLYLVMRHAAAAGRKPVIAAARNVHKTFLTAAALLHFDVQWIEPQQKESYLTGRISVSDLEQLLTINPKPAALWLTSPDYLGNLADIKPAADFCHKHDMLLIVDGAHGAYLRFLP
ncbi:MAG: amino acid decarboxylase, partial [Oscillospiraceae bacterium]|nr:amino acid decarboxylase [Oscillospiraceae bacterium]